LRVKVHWKGQAGPARLDRERQCRPFGVAVAPLGAADFPAGCYKLWPKGFGDRHAGLWSGLLHCGGQPTDNAVRQVWLHDYRL